MNKDNVTFVNNLFTIPVIKKFISIFISYFYLAKKYVNAI